MPGAAKPCKREYSILDTLEDAYENSPATFGFLVITLSVGLLVLCMYYIILYSTHNFKVNYFILKYLKITAITHYFINLIKMITFNYVY